MKKAKLFNRLLLGFFGASSILWLNAPAQAQANCRPGTIGYGPTNNIERCQLQSESYAKVGLRSSGGSIFKRMGKLPKTFYIYCNAMGFYPDGRIKFCDVSRDVNISVNDVSSTCPTGVGRVLVDPQGYVDTPRWCVRSE